MNLEVRLLTPKDVPSWSRAHELHEGDFDKPWGALQKRSCATDRCRMETMLAWKGVA